MLIDSHAHLTEAGFDDDRSDLLRRAHKAGVEAVVVIGYNVESSIRAVELATMHSVGPPKLWATVGFAPHNVAEANEASLAEVRELLARPQVVAVGEIGLDYHYDMPMSEQRALLDKQLGWASELDLPVVIHSREAEQDVVAALRRTRVRGVIHCFSEGAAMAEATLEMGFYISFSGILTFPSARALVEVAAAVPLEQTLIETDAPWLAPQPWRGQRNEPAYVTAVADKLAEIHAVDRAQVASLTTRNARELFGLAS